MSFLGFSQSNIKGIINNYAHVSDLDTCAAELSLDAVTGFGKGTKILIIQMQGAAMNETNSANYGNITNVGNAGVHELNFVDSIYGNSIYLKYFLRNKYDLNGNVQVVTIPQYKNVTVTDTLRATPWNGLSGGIIALESSGDITLNAPISADGAGFRGGNAVTVTPNNCSWVNNITDYFINTNNWRGTYKGEGLVMSKFGKECGRGAQSNGGGGGNDHNTGGGGGGQLTRGGNGGKNNEPSTFGCQGPNAGIGGKPIPNATNRLFFGGGGGAGHGNNGSASDGGRGGGICLIISKNILFNKYDISANGATAAVGFGDGAGGGGAGGTLLISTNSTLGTGSATAKGGNGGNQDEAGVARCMGTGGGGSGGRVLCTAVISANVAAGISGIIKNSTSPCNNTNGGAENGTNGIVENNVQLIVATELNSKLLLKKIPKSVIVCNGEQAIFTLDALGKNTTYIWQVDNGNGFVDATNGTIYNGVKTNTLIVDNYSPLFSSYKYRCILKDACGGSLFSNNVTMTVLSKPVASFSTAVTNNTTILTTNFSTPGASYFWEFGDGKTSTDKSPIHLYTKDDIYTITLKVTNACGSTIYSEDIAIVSPPKADFKYTNTVGCAPLTVTYISKSSANTSSVTWTFPGGDPPASTDDTVTVVYNIAGIYDVTLIAENTKFGDVAKFEKLVEIKPQPDAQFTMTVTNGQNVAFTNTSLFGKIYSWTFGDNAYSDIQNPKHTYLKDGTYTVTLVVQNDCGTKSISQKITIVTPPTANFVADTLTGCPPFVVKYKSTSSANTNNFFWTFEKGIPSTSTLPNPIVTYGETGVWDVSLVSSNVAGKDTLFKKGFVKVKTLPEAKFKFENTNAKNYIFKNSSINATKYAWDFGDKSLIVKENEPKHTYLKSGKYVVKLTASNECGSNVAESEIVINSQISCSDLGISFYPNPTYDVTRLTFGGEISSEITYLLCTIDGRVLERGVIAKDSSEKEFDLSNQASGVFVFYLKCDTQTFVRKVMHLNE